MLTMYHPPEQERVKASERRLEGREVVSAVAPNAAERVSVALAPVALPGLMRLPRLPTADGLTRKWVSDVKPGLLEFAIDVRAEITIVAFGPQTSRIRALDPRKMYRIERPRVQEAAEAFRRVPHKSQLILEEHGVITEIHDPRIPRIFFAFRYLNTIERLRVNEIIDVLAVAV
ncbi:hypothetical protein DACRYDRAFT_109027 [Dacryopinax primogenitus]|uniref:Uncharacterized protein n=1 Tax=Dacryopinax primogenitus (strain DJM 731) TaxID=1858805 RepID=M5FVH0_DACPD|nr:uncharacterized protein DACRYDRAFT_109027 [Dacryopinax primogenitus]EJU00289.1 hypothetical protein DACRYDRAFT_109027 [Dacryopinax primogenitus]